MHSFGLLFCLLVHEKEHEIGWVGRWEGSERTLEQNTLYKKNKKYIIKTKTYTSKETPKEIFLVSTALVKHKHTPHTVQVLQHPHTCIVPSEQPSAVIIALDRRRRTL